MAANGRVEQEVAKKRREGWGVMADFSGPLPSQIALQVLPANHADERDNVRNLSQTAFLVALPQIAVAFTSPPPIIRTQDAGWSSLVARQAHNLKAAGSNPAPATTPPPQMCVRAYRVYILQNAEGRFYIGLSENFGSRLNQHNANKSKWTKGKGPWEVVWQSDELSLTEARKLENRLKRQKGGCGLRKIIDSGPS
jgi:predicted GIY-YIG superfamily endonuclease